MKRILACLLLLQGSLAADTYVHLATIPDLFGALFGPVNLPGLSPHYELKIEQDKATLKNSLKGDSEVHFEVKRKENLLLLALDKTHWAHKAQDLGDFVILIEDEDTLNWNGRSFKKQRPIGDSKKD